MGCVFYCLVLKIFIKIDWEWHNRIYLFFGIAVLVSCIIAKRAINKRFGDVMICNHACRFNHATIPIQAVQLGEIICQENGVILITNCGFPCRLDSDFRNNVRSYLTGGFEKDGERIKSSKPPTDLQELIVNSAESVQRCVCLFFQICKLLTKIYLYMMYPAVYVLFSLIFL